MRKPLLLTEQDGDQNRTVGLRERKKARTSLLIQQCALRLFREQGYNDTTIEQVAAVADVSISTVFRYFPSKEDLAQLNDGSPFLLESLRNQPHDLTPIAALRAAFKEMFVSRTAEGLAASREREMIVLATPDLWAMNQEVITGIRCEIAKILAERVGRPEGDLAIRNIVGVVFGLMIAIWQDSSELNGVEIPADLDRALEHLEAGLPL